MGILHRKQLGQQQLRKCNSLDRLWQRTLDPPEEVNAARRYSDGRPGGRRSKKERRVERNKTAGDTLIFLVRRNMKRKEEKRGRNGGGK